MGEHSSLAGMDRFVDAAVRAVGVFCCWEDGVELGLLDVGFVAVDRLQCCLSIEREVVGSVTEDGT